MFRVNPDEKAQVFSESARNLRRSLLFAATRAIATMGLKTVKEQRAAAMVNDIINHLGS